MNATTLKRLEDKEEAMSYVREILAGDDKPAIYTVARRTRSGGYGISVDLSLFYFKDSTPWNITYYTGLILGRKVKLTDGYNTINNIGGGMDLGFDLVYSLSCELYAGKDRAGYVLNHRCL